MRVAGPLAYVDTWTTDGRMLLSSGLYGRTRVAIMRQVEDDPQPAIVGELERAVLWRGILWGRGEVRGTKPLHHASIAVDGEFERRLMKLVCTEWRLTSVVLMDAPNTAWAEGITVLEEE